MNDDSDPMKKSEMSSLKKKEKSSLLLSIFMHGDLVDMILMTIGFLASVGNGLAMPLSMLLVSKSMNILGAGPSSDPDHFRRSINQNTLIFFYLAGVSFMATFLEGYCWTRTGARQASRMRIRYLKAVLRQEISYFDLQDHNKFEVVTGVSNEILVIQDVLSEKIPNLVATLTRFVGGYTVALILMWRLALVAFPFVVLTIVPIMVSGRILMGLARKVRKEYNKARAIADQAISSIRTVYSFVGEKKTINEFAAALNESMKLGRKQGLAKGVAVGTPSITYAVWSFMIWYGSKMVMYHGAQGGTIQAVGFLIATGGFEHTFKLKELHGSFFSGRTYHGVVINRVPTIDSESMEGETLQNVSGEVKFKNVKFAYPSRPTNIIFHNLNLEVSAGKKLALVGVSGSGKSTVIALLERFYDPLDGQILLDGISINKLQLKWFRSQMGLVSQEPALFATSIKENILFGKEDGNMEEVIAAAKASNVHSFISQLPQGYDTLVGEGGTQISGGQKQRIAIARAVIKLPRVLLLDEATSALDSESEKIVQDALDKVAIDRTTIIIAHHLSTICNADTIVVIQDGKVMENGSHKELMRIDNGLYSSLIQLQQASKFTKDREDEQNETSSSSHITYRDERNNSTDLPLERQSSSFSDADSVEQAEAKFNIKHVSQNNTSSYQRLLLLSLTEWKQASLGFVSALLSGSVQPIYAFVMGSMVSAFFLNDHSRIKSKTRIYSLILICLSVFSSLTTVNLHYNFASMGEQFTKKIRERMLTKVLTFEVGWFDQEQNTSGAICSRLSNDANVVRSLMGDQMPLLAQTLSTVLIAYALGLIIAWRLSIVMLAIQPLTILCYYLRKALLKRLAQKATNSQAESSKLTAEVVSNIRTITAFSSQTRILTLLNRAQAGPQRENIRQSWIAGTILGAAVAVNSINSAIVFWYGRKLISQGYITPTALFKTFLILVHTGQGIADAGSTTTEIAKGAAAAQSIFGLLDRVTEIEPEKLKGHQPNYLVGQVELHDIDFAYPARPDVMIFKGLSLKIEAKKSTALVGCSGSGKSTVINLIERFYDPLRGRVVIDGKDVRTYNLRAMRKQVALVSQEPNLFEGTIKENIAYGASESVDESEVIGAARIANAHDFIVGLRDGYNTRCGDKGVQLSGGQKQRLAIARAILKNPAILLLDEATSALDSRSEKVVQEALDQVMAGRTSVVVAHRLTTIRNCDEIVVLDKGIVVEKGTHLSLMEKGLTGSFCSLVTLQQKPTNKKFLE